MVTINQLAKMAIEVANKRAYVKNIHGDEFKAKYGFKCPQGVRGRNSDNKLYKEHMGWEPSQPLRVGIEKTYKWVNKQLYG
jgi:nucleoside-diphosphate-sugar epimerase